MTREWISAVCCQCGWRARFPLAKVRPVAGVFGDLEYLYSSAHQVTGQPIECPLCGGLLRVTSKSIESRTSSKTTREKRKEARVCVRCGHDSGGRYYCDACVIRIRESQRVRFGRTRKVHCSYCGRADHNICRCPDRDTDRALGKERGRGEAIE